MPSRRWAEAPSYSATPATQPRLSYGHRAEGSCTVVPVRRDPGVDCWQRRICRFPLLLVEVRHQLRPQIANSPAQCTRAGHPHVVTAAKWRSVLPEELRACAAAAAPVMGARQAIELD
eukprot:scaffold12382_cov118-Isochrysis_galbana.AAC.8